MDKLELQCEFLYMSEYNGKPMLYRCLLKPRHKESHRNPLVRNGEGKWRRATEKERFIIKRDAGQNV
jgi:hypothetical protein